MIRATGVSKCPPLTATVALVGFSEQDRDVLQDVFDCSDCPVSPGCKWSIQPSVSVQAAVMGLCRNRTEVVLCDRDLAPEAWKELLVLFRAMAEPPCLIVTSRLADDYLWAEALNLGAYDVLARPFDRAEVLRTVNLAGLHWQRRHPTPPSAAPPAA